MIVGSRRYQSTVYREGVAMLFHGSPGGVGAWPLWTTGSGQSGARYGSSVASAGDVNGDGYADVLVGAEEYTNDYSGEGRAYLYLGSPIGLSGLPDWTFDGGQKGAFLGTAVASAGDVNGDGYDDVIVGARLYSGDYNNEGAAFIFYGSPDGLSPAPDLVLLGGRAGATFGHSVASAGDVNGDGYDDVLVGAPQYSDGLPAAGAAFLFYGSPAGLNPTPGWTFVADQAGVRLGTSVAGVGDLNGDGFADVVVGAPLYDDGLLENAGAVWVFLGSPAGLDPTPHQILTGDVPGSQFGYSVAPLGDVSDDTFADIIVGAPYLSDDQFAEGAALIFCGSPSGLIPTPAWRGFGNKAETLYGHSVASAGDVNGDGLPDFAVGAPTHRISRRIVGRAYLYEISLGERPFRLFVPMVLNSSR